MPLTRSEHMARVRGVDTSPERILRSALWRVGVRYRLHRKILSIRPDIVIPGRRVVIFVDGCFWHGCPSHYSRPRSRESFWAEKLVSNVNRDRGQTLKLEADGWKVIRVWEHEVFTDIHRVVELVEAICAGRATPKEREWRVVRVEPDAEKGPDWERRVLCLLRDASVVRDEVGRRKTGWGKHRIQ